jgi:DNA end-binding protein Ku
MPRAIWSGSISFGLVNVPVKVHTAVRDHAAHFHQVEKGSGARIRYEKVSEQSGDPVSADDIELGYELAKKKLVTVDRDQLDELRPRSTRTVEIADFVDLSEVDPAFYDRTYWLVPDGEGARRPYALLVAAMEDRRQAGIGTVVMRNKQYLAAIRPRDSALAMSTMHFADEIVPVSQLDGLPGRSVKPAPKELRLATQIIDSLNTEWNPKRYRDTYVDEVRKLIEKQAEGKHVVVEASAAQGAPVTDLMAVLEASLKAAAKSGGTRSSRLRAMEKAAAEVPTDDADQAKPSKRASSPRRPRKSA